MIATSPLDWYRYVSSIITKNSI